MLKFCSRCGCSALESDFFCSYCGNRMKDDLAESDEKKPRACSWCGGEIKPDDHFCGVCGRKADEEPPEDFYEKTLYVDDPEEKKIDAEAQRPVGDLKTEEEQKTLSEIADKLAKRAASRCNRIVTEEQA